MNYHFKLGLLMACLLFLFSCQKEEILDQPPTVEDTVTLESIIGDDSMMDKFFNGVNAHDVPVSDDKKATVDQIKLAMAKDHKTTSFVGDYIRQVGFPLWGQAKLQQQADGDFLYALPFAKANSTFTTAILHIAVQEEKFVYELALRTDINEYLAAYSSGNQTFYWENLLAFLGGFNEYDNVIFNFYDSLFVEWFSQNKDTYLTDVADTRGCESYIYTVCVWNITLQKSGEERSSGCDGTTYQVIVTICSDPNSPGAPGGPHQPGGQTGGVPSIGGGGGSSSPINNTETGSGPGENPGIDPGTWGDEGSNEPSNIQMILLERFIDDLKVQGQFAWYDHDSQQYLAQTIKDKIFSFNFDSDNAHALVDVMEGHGVDFGPLDIDFLLTPNDPTIQEITEFLETNDDVYSLTSTKVYTNLKRNNLLNLDPNNLTNSQINRLNSAFQDNFSGNLLGHRQLSADSWFKIVQKENSSCSDCGWLESIRKSIDEGWNAVFKPFKDGLQTVFDNLGDAMPGTDQEWKALLTVYGPMLTTLTIDIGTDFIPGVGELKGFYKCSNAYAADKYGEAALEFIGAIAGILPIGDLINASTGIVTTGIKIFAAYKVIKAISNVSSGIFSKITTLAGQGWNFVWDDGLKKLIFRNPDLGDDLFELTTRNINNVDVPLTKIKKANGWSLFRRAEIENLNPIQGTIRQSDGKMYFSRDLLNQNSRRLSVTEPADINILAQAIRNGDQSGQLTEELADKVFREVYPNNTGRIWGDGASHNIPSSGNGLDNVVQLPDGTLVIAECKPLSSSGTIELASPSVGVQMGTDWIYDAANKMTQTSDPSLQSWGNIVKNAIDNNTPIERVLIAVDKSNGDILITKLNAFN